MDELLLFCHLDLVEVPDAVWLSGGVLLNLLLRLLLLLLHLQQLVLLLIKVLVELSMCGSLRGQLLP